ncbi:MAG TPA: hypothetical protein VH877_28445 [Polyangia bacterium]|nr:hypothetical protein [Polyangia bacterium]
MAALSLALAIVGTFFSLLPVVGAVAGVPISLIAMVLGLLARREAIRAGQPPSRAARAGIILGILGAVLGVVTYVGCILWMRSVPLAALGTWDAWAVCA